MAFTSIPLVCDSWAQVADGSGGALLICPTGSAMMICGDVIGQPTSAGIPIGPGEKIITPAGLAVWACGAGADGEMLVTTFGG